MSSTLDSIVQLGHDITALKYHSLATTAILFYDYFLTLADEIKYVWSGNKSWTFWLFIFIRYFPMTWQFWQLRIAYTPHLDMTVCEKSAWYSLFAFALCTLFAQVTVTLRIYAVMMKNVPITIGFAVITASQFVLGMWITVRAARSGAQMLPPIPLDAYDVCIFVRHRTPEVVYTSISLLFDFLASSLIIYRIIRVRKNALGHKFTTILDTVAEDSTWYFLLVFSAHFTLVMTLHLARPAIQLLPAPGILVYLPVMVSRTVLSLRKAAKSPHNTWSLLTPFPESTDLQGVELSYLQRSTTWRGNNVRLGTHLDPEGGDPVK